ncbi:hypothetical protein AAE478_001192 [Parahypoxylon ruwenzoriense]
MLSQTTLALLGLASTAAAALSPDAIRNLHNLRAEKVVVEVRQAQTSSAATISGVADGLECTASILSLVTGAPQPPDDLLSFYATAATTIDPSDTSAMCAMTSSMPQSLASVFSSYENAGSSWFSEHSSEIQAIISKCGDNDNVSYLEQAASDFEAGNGCGAASATTTSSSDASGSNGGSSVSQGGVARPTGAVAAAVAAAAFLGAAVML